jgi:hypothetical protein
MDPLCLCFPGRCLLYRMLNCFDCEMFSRIPTRARGCRGQVRGDRRVLEWANWSAHCIGCAGQLLCFPGRCLLYRMLNCFDCEMFSRIQVMRYKPASPLHRPLTATKMPGPGKASIASHQGQRLSGTSEGRQTSRWILCVSAFLVVAYFIVCSIVSIVRCSPVSKS